MRKKFIYGALGVGTLALVALPIFAGGGACGERGGHDFGRHGFGGHGAGMLSDRMIAKLSRKLDLEDSQREALFAAADEARPTFRQMREQLRESRRAMHTLDPKADDYDAKVAELADQHSALAGRMTMAMAGVKSTLSEVLSEAQMQKLMAMRKHRHGGRHHDYHEDDHHKGE